MKLLAVDTALGACSAAVLDDENVLAHRLEPMERGHAERIAPMVREVMEESGIAFANLDRLAVTIGPGTFTGQRVGMAFMRGLRIALKRPLVGITTLEAMIVAAKNSSGWPAAAALHDARRGEVYCAAMLGNDLVVPVCLLRAEEALRRIGDATREAPLAFAGTAGEQASQVYRTEKRKVQWTGILQPDALWVARLGRVGADPDAPPRPLYLRPPDARLPGGIQ